MMVTVHDQDEALAFYVDKLGFEVRADIPFAGHRWLTVGLPDQDVEVCLLPPEMGPQSDEVKAQTRNLMALGALSAGIIRTDDCRADYQRLLERGVEFTEEPVERFYGIDAGFRDPSGNPGRLTQPAAIPAGATS